MTMKSKGLIGIIVLAFMLSGCSTAKVETNEGHAGTPTTNVSDQQQLASKEDIHIIIDQTEKPIEGETSSFDFVVKKRPEGYALSSMEWSSANHNVVNSFQEAIQHGKDGEDGFYISGNGQFMGFFYDKSLVGEIGTVSFTFTNEQGDALTWSKEITLL